MPIHATLRRLTISTLNTMRRETECADFRSEIDTFRFSVNDLAYKSGQSPAKVLEALAELREKKLVTEFPAKHKNKKDNNCQPLWQLSDIEDVVADFYLKFS